MWNRNKLTLKTAGRVGVSKSFKKWNEIYEVEKTGYTIIRNNNWMNVVGENGTLLVYTLGCIYRIVKVHSILGISGEWDCRG